MAKILYIEDEPEIAELVRRWLEEDDEHRVLQAAEGSGGLALADSERPDLILLDLNLGRFSIDGWEVNRRLKADPGTQSIPVIALTAHAQRVEHRERALAEGFVQHISKPFDYDTLIDQVRAFTRKEGTT
jgi:two-component system cell cycle response regulator DivK